MQAFLAAQTWRLQHQGHGFDSMHELRKMCAFNVEIDRYIGLPIFSPIFKHFTVISPINISIEVNDLLSP